MTILKCSWILFCRELEYKLIDSCISTGLALGGEPTAGEMDGRSNNEQSASIVGSREETYTCDEGDAMLHEERLDRWIEPQKCINQKPNASVF